MGWLDSPSILTESVEHVKAVKAEGLDVGVDFHGRLHKPMAKQLAKLLEDVRPLFIEGEASTPFSNKFPLTAKYQNHSCPPRLRSSQISQS
jgi:hypothetical protein